MIWVSKETLIKSHTMLIKQFGGLDGVLREDALDLALNNPLQTFDGQDLYPTDLDKITKLSYNIVNLHPFIDGNKRSGANTLLVLAKLNKFELDFSQEELSNLFLSVAAKEITYNQFKQYVMQKSLENKMQR